MTCMDESHRLVQPVDVDPNAEISNSRPGYVLVLGATNRLDAVDPALRRSGRFDREIVLGVPGENARVQILFVLTRNLRLEGAFDLLKIARSMPGFVGVDLAALANKAGNLAMKRIIDRRKSEQSREPIDEDHTEDWWRLPWLPEEMENLSITMADFEEAAKLVQPSSRREGFSAIPNGFGVDLETGFLLYGPRGCGKTFIAKAVDALTTKHGKEGGWVVERLLNQLLVELDAAEQRQGVYVIGATNRPVVMDRTVLRPGRFGKLKYVPLPSPDERGLILKALARKKPIDAGMNEAAMAALEEKLIARSSSSDATSLTIKKMHFEQALEKISPSVSSKPWGFWKRIYYQKWWPAVGDCPDVTGWLKGGRWPKACLRVAKACWRSQGD
ncbi:hypothetical protein TEA_012813 [Camellia sinensis var. sinensis]|uniref:ATPase AAA-type core domain-containing protein n=1 Tax=Camellia sinensis var. sinensis TaxID=542762 RepID=A0A4V6RY17_CAMSN|nr:hypothetical protein TEA_012813 [Camellia sinensis var. sinensis]